MNYYIKTALVVLGIIFVFLGAIGLFVPILQGILFLVVGVYLLTLSSDRFKAWFDRHMLRFPRAKGHFDRHSERVRRFWKGREGQ